MFLFFDFLPTDFWFIFSFDPLPPLKLWQRCWLMGPDVSLPVQETCDILIILQTINSVFRSELLQTDKLNLYFYINKLICWISLFFVFAKHRTFLFWSGLKLYESKGVQQDNSKAQMARCSPNWNICHSLFLAAIVLPILFGIREGHDTSNQEGCNPLSAKVVFLDS